MQAKPEAGSLIVGTVALLVAATSSILIVSTESMVLLKLHIFAFKTSSDQFIIDLRMFNLQPKFGGKIIDIVSGDIHTPEQKFQALEAVKSTILDIFLIVIVGYVHCGLEFLSSSKISQSFHFHTHNRILQSFSVALLLF